MVAVLLVSAVWSIWDDNISRRPWKQYQVEWDHLAYDKYMKDAAEEQKRLNANPEYQKGQKDLAEAQKELDSGRDRSQARRLARRRWSISTTSPTTKIRRCASPSRILTERWYDYNHAIQYKQDPAPYQEPTSTSSTTELAQENIVSDKAKTDLQAVKDQIDEINSKVDRPDRAR